MAAGEGWSGHPSNSCMDDSREGEHFLLHQRSMIRVYREENRGHRIPSF